MLDAVIARLKLQVPFLEERVEDAADFNQLLASNALPQSPIAAHVLPLGLRGGRPDAATGIFRQTYDEAVSVVLTIRSNDRTGQNALKNIDGNIKAIIAAIAGWAPGDEVGVFRLVSSRVVLMQRGTFVYQIDFSIQDQLRIAS